MPFKDGIVELRQKGASLRLIRELLATVDVAVGTDTIARFLAEVNGEPMPQRPAKRTGRRRGRAETGSPSAASTRHRSLAQPSAPAVHAPHTGRAAERPRTRGPRIADPRNL